jgi:hypothetical protein
VHPTRASRPSALGSPGPQYRLDLGQHGVRQANIPIGLREIVVVRVCRDTSPDTL